MRYTMRGLCNVQWTSNIYNATNNTRTVNYKLLYLIMSNNTEYQAYLLRLRRGRDQTHWRAMLRDASSGETYHFATERELISYLVAALQTTIHPQELNLTSVPMADTI